MADQLKFPNHFLVDLEDLTPAARARRCDELIAWAKRYAKGNANPKWVEHHMFELARLAEMMRGKPVGINSENDN